VPSRQCRPALRGSWGRTIPPGPPSRERRQTWSRSIRPPNGSSSRRSRRRAGTARSSVERSAGEWCTRSIVASWSWPTGRRSGDDAGASPKATRVGGNGVTEALLALEDGTVFRGRSFGATGETFGEAVFNTAMSGYQEVLTDPSYAGQIVTMTSPHQGNYGTNAEDPESARVRVAGFVVREASRRASSWRATGTLCDELADAGVIGIDEVDTRRVTLRLRDRGAMRCAISTEDVDPDSLVERVRAAPAMEGADLATGESTTERYDARDLVGPASSALGRVFRVVAYDFGLKRTILRRLADVGIEATVVPAVTPATEIGEAVGVFLSNRPAGPARTRHRIPPAKTVR